MPVGRQYVHEATASELGSGGAAANDGSIRLAGLPDHDDERNHDEGRDDHMQELDHLNVDSEGIQGSDNSEIRHQNAGDHQQPSTQLAHRLIVQAYQSNIRGIR